MERRKRPWGEAMNWLYVAAFWWVLLPLAALMEWDMRRKAQAHNPR